MKRSNNLLRIGIGALSLALLGMLPAQVCAQTLGQQVSPEPLGGAGTTQPNGESNPSAQMNSQSGSSGVYGNSRSGQQSTSMPMNIPGTGPMSSGGVGVFGTGADIPQTSPNTQIAEGDLLDIVIFDTPELSGRFRVDSKGNILLPLAGSLHVASMTLPQITDAVAQRYKDAEILVDPQVTVFVAEFSRRTITITGEVRAPGVYPVTAPRTLTDTLAMAGGLSDTASRTVSIVHAANPNEIVHVTLNVGAQTPESLEQGRIEILPGDSIFVARSGVVYVVGQLNRPGGYQVEHNNRLTLLEAVALAGGLTRTAKGNHSRLIRRSATGREEISIDLDKVLYGGGPDMLLTDGDILYVPASARKEYTQQAISAALGAGAAYGIYRISNF